MNKCEATNQNQHLASNQSSSLNLSRDVSSAVAMLDSLIADMEAFGDNNGDKEADDLEKKVDLLTEKLKTAFNPQTDMANFRWSLSGEETEHDTIGVCSSCKKDISGKSVLVGEYSYHETCFVCFHCGNRLVVSVLSMYHIQ